MNTSTPPDDRMADGEQRGGDPGGGARTSGLRPDAARPDAARPDAARPDDVRTNGRQRPDQQYPDAHNGDVGQDEEVDPVTDRFLLPTPAGSTAWPTRAMRDAAFGRGGLSARPDPTGAGPTGAGPTVGGPVGSPTGSTAGGPDGPARRVASRAAELPTPDAGGDVVPLPAAPALVCDRSGCIVRVNPALLRLVGRAPADRSDGGGGDGGPGDGGGDGVSGRNASELLLGPDPDARLVRPDGHLVRVRVVRWELPGTGLTAAVLVELGSGSAVAPTAGGAPARRTAELERLARVGTWTFDLDGGILGRSETLEELYRSVGVAVEETGWTPFEGEQVARLCQELRAGHRPAPHHVELRLPGDRTLRCRAEVEYAADGRAVRLLGMVRDLTPDQSTQRRLEHSGQRFADLMAMVPGGVALLDPDARVVDANPGMCALLDVPLEVLRGTAATALTADDDGFDDPLAPADPTGRPHWLREVGIGARYGYRLDEVALRRGDGTTVWCELVVSATSVDDGGWFWLIVCTDVSERRRAARLLRRAGTVDELTQLPNRAAAVELVDRLLTGPDRDHVAVACGDLDDFARVNSSLGHEAGDELLVTLAARLQRELPMGCTAARLSGDEFVVICSDHAAVGGPYRLAHVVADLLRTTITVHGRPVQMTASVGLAIAPPTGDPRAADLLRYAEAAMHDAKRTQCREGIGIATDGVVTTATNALELEAELRDAIASDGLLLDYQPVVGPDGTVLSAEALVRWPHPVRGLIPPGDFLPVAQRSGLLRELDIWVLRTATREAATWVEHQGVIPSVAVNLAGLLPGDVDFRSTVGALVADAGLPWDRLVLELVETSLVALPPHALAAMAQLVERGVRFAVDDFGTGYSSLARLKELPAQTVKVDRAFVTGVADDPADFAVARAVVDMARAMGRTTVAEGVETAEQFHALRGIGVDAYQGWLFARAMPPAELRAVIAGHRMATPVEAAAGL